MTITQYRARNENFTPADIALAGTRNCVSRRVFKDNHLYIRGKDGRLYTYDHWEITPLDEYTEKVTLYLKAVKEGS